MLRCFVCKSCLLFVASLTHITENLVAEMFFVIAFISHCKLGKIETRMEFFSEKVAADFTLISMLY